MRVTLYRPVFERASPEDWLRDKDPPPTMPQFCTEVVPGTRCDKCHRLMATPPEPKHEAG